MTNTAVLKDIAGYQKSADRLIFKETTNQQQNVDLGQAKLFPGLAEVTTTKLLFFGLLALAERLVTRGHLGVIEGEVDLVPTIAIVARLDHTASVRRLSDVHASGSKFVCVVNGTGFSELPVDSLDRQYAGTQVA